MKITIGLLIGLAALVSQAVAETVLFPAPLHLTRRVQDPVSGTVSVIDEYLAGNRVIAVNGAKSSIADYAKQELTVIDRERGTYSVTRFDEIGRVGASGRVVRADAGPDNLVQSQVRVLGPKSVGQRNADVFEVEIPGQGAPVRVSVAVDREIALSRDAFEVLTGAAWPNQRSAESEAMRRMALRGESRKSGISTAAVSESYGLPIEQITYWTIDGESLELRITVTRVGHETAPEQALALPPGAERVESDLVVRERMLRELDELPQPSNKQP